MINLNNLHMLMKQYEHLH